MNIHVHELVVSRVQSYKTANKWIQKTPTITLSMLTDG